MGADGERAAQLARLRKGSEADRRALDALAADIDKLLSAWDRDGPPGRPDLTVIAVDVHGYYTGLETLLERIARLLDESVPKGSDWHRDLVEQMGVEIRGVRPAVLPDALSSELGELRKFRHFFRNAYAVHLDPAKVREHAEGVRRVHAPVRAALVAFDAHLDAVIELFARG